jgi:heme exporter protein A
MNGTLRLAGEGLAKTFDRRTVFRGVSFSVEAGQALLITGRNGSGKSTLVKIICGVLGANGGTVRLDGPAAGSPESRNAIGLVAPYLQMFDEFTAAENLAIAMGIRGLPFDAAAADALLDRVTLSRRKRDPVRTFSSGMKQRVKYACALLHRPGVLVLDEPMANLDAEGVVLVRAIMEEHRRTGILVVATNDLGDLHAFDSTVDLNDRRG